MGSEGVDLQGGCGGVGENAEEEGVGGGEESGQGDGVGVVKGVEGGGEGGKGRGVLGTGDAIDSMKDNVDDIGSFRER